MRRVLKTRKTRKARNIYSELFSSPTKAIFRFSNPCIGDQCQCSNLLFLAFVLCFIIARLFISHTLKCLHSSVHMTWCLLLNWSVLSIANYCQLAVSHEIKKRWLECISHFQLIGLFCYQSSLKITKLSMEKSNESSNKTKLKRENVTRMCKKKRGKVVENRERERDSNRLHLYRSEN